jgi:cobaltochelatase CobT
MLSAQASAIEPGNETSTNPYAQAAAWQRAYGTKEEACPLASSGHPIAPQDTSTRSGADALAAWQRWHNPQHDQLFTVEEWPWYAAIERARVEILAGRHLPGMAINLAQPDLLQPVETTLARLYLAARKTLSGESTPFISPPTAAPALIKTSAPTPAGWWHKWFNGPSSRHRPTSQKVTSCLDDASINNTLLRARNVLTDGGLFANALLPLVRGFAGFHTVSDNQGHPASLPAQPNHDGAGPPAGEHAKASTETTVKPSDSTTQPSPKITHAYPGYRIFTTHWDEEALAARWQTPQDSEAVRNLSSIDHIKTRQLAQRLQRRLLAARLRNWSFDQEEGLLDSRSLARLLTEKNNHKVFRTEADALIPEACVTLLVDQSGSMRGERQRMSALAIDLAVHALEACQIRCEVLGYTTRFGITNPVEQRWHQAGSPNSPGRLNALRHIIYKTPHQPWRHVRPYLGLMLHKGFGCENVDGEALYWAAQRLIRAPQPRKILIVLSDGTPHDEATAQANGREFLENHLRKVIADIENSPIYLVAIGTGQAVGRYYRQALAVRQSGTVASILFDRLGDLLTLPSSPSKNRNL